MNYFSTFGNQEFYQIKSYGNICINILPNLKVFEWQRTVLNQNFAKSYQKFLKLPFFWGFEYFRVLASFEFSSRVEPSITRFSKSLLE